MRRCLPILLVSVMPALPVLAQDNLLPTPYPVNRYTDIWENSPFNREVIKEVVTGPQTSFSQNLVLEGVVTDDTRGTVAYVRDIREDKPLVITSNETDGHPYRVVGANQEHDPEKTKVTITDGKETGEIGFNAQKLTQAIAVPAPAPAPAGGRQPNQPPGRDAKAKPPVNPPGGAPGNVGAVVPPVDATGNPASGAPILDKIDSEPRRRRVPLPGQ